MKPCALLPCLLLVACSTGPSSPQPLGGTGDSVRAVESVSAPSGPGIMTTASAAFAPAGVPEVGAVEEAPNTDAHTTAFMLRTLVQQCTGSNEQRTLAMYRCSGAYAELKKQRFDTPAEVDGFFNDLNALNAPAFSQLGQFHIGGGIGGGARHREIDELLVASPQKYELLMNYARLLKAEKISEVQLKDFKLQEEKIIIKQFR